MRERSAGAGSTVLILSTDSVTAGLLGILAEIEGYHPLFAGAGEPPEHSIARLRPTVALVDCDHAAACADALFDEARATGTRVIIFSPGRMRDDVRSFAEERSLPWFALPIDRAALARALQGTLASTLPFALLTLLR